jgi:hypothetical protein
MKKSDPWPALPLSEWKDTYATLHRWTQIVGKVRLALCPRINHWWGAALYVTSRGLTTSAIPFERGVFEVQFDFVAHMLEISTSSGESRAFRLIPRTVADFYAELMSALQSLGIEVKVCRWKFLVRFASTSMNVMRPTTANLRIDSGRFW